MSGERFSQEWFEYYQTHPVEFIEDVVYKHGGLTDEEIVANLPGNRIEPESKQIMQAVEGNNYVAVRSGHGISKTFTASCLTIWFLTVFPEAKVVITGPKYDQLKITLWTEIQKWLRRSDVQDVLTWNAETVTHSSSPGTWFATMVTSKTSENIAGIHGDHLLIIIDEASGVEPSIFEALLGCMTGPHNHMLALGNPTKTSGFFYDAHHQDAMRIENGIKTGMWFAMHFSSENSSIVKPEWLARLKAKYNEDSDIYRVRVKGDFPRGNPKAIVSFEDCEAARMRDVDDGDFIELGCDPALEGDDLFTIAVRLGDNVKEIRTYPKTTPTEMVRHVLTTVRQWRRQTGIDGAIRVKVDAGGGYGAALIEALALNESDNIECVPVKSNNKATNPEYRNYGTQMWFEFAAIINRIGLPNDTNLIDELSNREWTISDPVTIEPKTKFKSRFGQSPDRADAVILSFADGPKKVFATPKTATSTKDFEIDWTRERIRDPQYDGPIMSELLHLAVLVANSDLSINGLAAFYERYLNKLWVYREFYQQVPDPERIASEVKYHCHRGMFAGVEETADLEVRVLGNRAMFHKDHNRRSLADVINSYGLYVGEASYFDEFGAIAQGVKMFDDQKIILHSCLLNARPQINTWSIRQDKVEDNVGFCEALLLMLSEVRKSEKENPILKYRYISPYSGKPNDYHPMNEPKKNDTRPTAWMAR